MHIPDGFLNPATAALMYAVAFAFLAWSWKKAKAVCPGSFVALLAVSSAFVFTAHRMDECRDQLDYMFSLKARERFGGDNVRDLM